MRETDINKLKAAVLYITNKLGRTGFHKLFKILYFADMEHLANYGRVVVINDYVAMQRGPVPSTLYNILKEVRDGNPDFISEIFAASIKIEDYFVTPVEQPDLEELSESDISCLNNAINKIGHLSMVKITQLSHGFAYKNAWEATDRRSYPIDIYDIAIEGGATKERIAEIREIEILTTHLA